MVQLTKEEKEELLKFLEGTHNKVLNSIKKKLIEKQVTLKYALDRKGILAVLRRGLREKKNVRIRYYSLSSDQVTTRVVSIYKLHTDFIIGYCHLRKEERTFVTHRINAAAILPTKYSIPKNYMPKSIVTPR